MAAEKKTKTENEGRTTTSETKAPLAVVLERYGDGRKTDNRKEAKEAREAAKKKLVADLVGRLELRGGESRDQLRARLGKTSNAKLLRLRERVEGS